MPTAPVETLISELQDRVRDRVRRDLLEHGASPALEDQAVFAEVDRLLRAAMDRTHPAALLLPEIMGDPEGWRLETAARYQSHRSPVTAAIVVFVKRRVLMPLQRWLFEYSRDNFARQRRVNQVLFACVQELAIESARLRQELLRRDGGTR